jgi:hypothetical protein
MSRILVPLPNIQLDPRNTDALLNTIQTRIFLESNGLLNDFSPASPLAALTEGQAFAHSELLYYLNQLPEAFVLQWLKLMGIQRIVGAHAYAEILFFRQPGYQRPVYIPENTQFFSGSGLKFFLTSPVEITDQEPRYGVVKSEKWGTIYNVPANSLVRTTAAIAGLSSFYNPSPAFGGESQESVGEMKSRAFTTLNRRGLITKQDFQLEIQNSFPELENIGVFTYDELSPFFEALSKDSIYISYSIANSPMSEFLTSEILKVLRLKTPIGTSVSVIAPRVHKLRIDISFEYRGEQFINIESLSSSIYVNIREYILSLQMGSELNLRDIEGLILAYSEVSVVNAVIIGSLNLFSDQEEPNVTGCSSDYETFVDEFDVCQPVYSWELSNDLAQTYFSAPIDLYNLFEFNVSAVNTSTLTSTNYKYVN